MLTSDYDNDPWEEMPDDPQDVRREKGLRRWARTAQLPEWETMPLDEIEATQADWDVRR